MINLNMIADRRVRKNREVTILRVSLLGVGLLILAMAALNVTWFFMYQADKKTNLYLQNRLAYVQPQENRYEQLQADIVGLQPVVDLLQRVRVTEGAWMTILADLSRVIPKDVTIGGVNATSGSSGVTLSMNGSAGSPKNVGDFMVALREGTSWADNSTLNSVNSDDVKSGERGVHFSLTVPVRGLFGGDL